MSGIITKGYGKNQRIITQGYGGIFKVEVKKIVEVGYAPHYEIRIFEKKLPVLGDAVFELKETIKVTGIVDLYELVLALQNEKPSTEDDILELLNIYEDLRLQIKFEEVTDSETMDLFVKTKKLLDEMFKKLKKEVEKDNGNRKEG